ncbi:hypothetical protein DERP_001893 [Dermatophagoides pteronyssinus]|uniref:Methyltransferase type 12 domain-containing protein n=1 Tax=Dermatophagoides pteronyssinus TaxID=6956 RepID=A0ABQ8JBT7_DERPT|nr:hypothetical protein DERP_001893 [Dermatophagoides pteronyssinus]
MDYDAEKYDSGAADAQQPARKLIRLIQDYVREKYGREQTTFDSLIIVDLGCGPGNTAEMLANQFPGAKIVGLDIDPEMIDFARTKHPEHKFFVQNIEQPWSEWPEDFRSTYENKVDIIFANYALHWIDNTNSFADTIRQLLRPTGMFTGNLLYCGWLQSEDNSDDKRDEILLNESLDYPREMEFVSKFFWSLRTNGNFHWINMEYQEPVSRFGRQFYTESFIEIPLKWYRKFLKRSMNDQEIGRLNETLKRLILKQRICKVIPANKDDPSSVEQIDLRQQLYIFKAIKN